MGAPRRDSVVSGRRREWMDGAYSKRPGDRDWNRGPERAETEESTCRTDSLLRSYERGLSLKIVRSRLVQVHGVLVFCRPHEASTTVLGQATYSQEMLQSHHCSASCPRRDAGSPRASSWTR